MADTDVITTGHKKYVEVKGHLADLELYCDQLPGFRPMAQILIRALEEPHRYDPPEGPLHDLQAMLRIYRNNEEADVNICARLNKTLRKLDSLIGEGVSESTLVKLLSESIDSNLGRDHTNKAWYHDLSEKERFSLYFKILGYGETLADLKGQEWEEEPLKDQESAVILMQFQSSFWTETECDVLIDHIVDSITDFLEDKEVIDAINIISGDTTRSSHDRAIRIVLKPGISFSK